MTLDWLRVGWGVGLATGILGCFDPPPASAQTPTNSCLHAPFVPVPGVFSGSTIGATSDGTASCGTSGSSPDVWLKHTATRTAILIAGTCERNEFDSILSVRSSCQGGELACNDDSCGISSRLSCRVEEGQTYWIRISGFSGEIGPFQLNVEYADLPPDPTIGADLIVGEITGVRYWGADSGVLAFSVGSTLCNIGNVPATWEPQTDRHAVIAQNMFRIKSGRIEQIGQSWVRHTTHAANDGACGVCVPGAGQVLGVGCSDPYGTGLMGDQSSLSPRSTVRASSGEIAFPAVAPPAASVIDRRLQVRLDDIDPEVHQDATFIVESLVVHFGDADAAQTANNVSHRRVNFAGVDTDPVLAGTIVAQRPAITAWKDSDPRVSEAIVDFVEGTRQARYIIAANVVELPGGAWRYEYAVYNQNSARAAGSFAVMVPTRAILSEIGFHDVDYHSGDGIDGVNHHNTDWTPLHLDGELRWETDSFADKPNSNALRWGTLYNFWFQTNVAPTVGRVRLGLFEPGGPAEPVSLWATNLPVPRCPADWTNDGFVNSQDFFDFVMALFDGNADFNGDQFNDSQDFFDYLAAFFDGC